MDANSGMKPGPFTRKTVKEWFIEDTIPREVDNTKVGITVDGATGGRWQEGCAGPKEVRGFLNLSKVESEFPSWGKYNRGWIARAARGVGVVGKEGSATGYFYEGWNPFGRTWGAPFAPKGLCKIPAPTPTPPPAPTPIPSGPPPSLEPTPAP